VTDRVGQQLGNYRLVGLLGQGGYAEVYLGQHVRLSLQAAIKVLHTHLTVLSEGISYLKSPLFHESQSQLLRNPQPKSSNPYSFNGDALELI